MTAPAPPAAGTGARSFDRARPPFGPTARAWKVVAASTLIGVIAGAIPGAGGAISTFLSCDRARRMSRRPGTCGTGSPEGLIAPECSNNATAGGALIPMRTLGVPGEVAIAVLTGGLAIQGTRPGPALFDQKASLVYAIFPAFLLAGCAMFLIQLFGIRLFARILGVPMRIMMPLIMMFCMISVYGVNGAVFELGLTLGFGGMGFFLNRDGFGTAPVILGLILGR
ncbi:tripartite tricarboxylate transporter permease [Mangrovicoccus algicola]|uniref:Tripartite tricarboxylate transporter permease n=1 Tax=Mangrovicoccus algicola TaxID=2771008 RepID=A0A8J7CKH4_9RHOB|nr:tripartite tricarboxylate transporter permease [Mangrovicoccus algicola]MBE3638821.1 tripartite tricarboxylate transporter permease [Mangrovicoccus algicola]